MLCGFSGPRAVAAGVRRGGAGQWRRNNSACPFGKKVQPMPKLPVPELHKTLEQFMRSSKPIMNCSEMCESEEVVKKFGAAGGQGEHLQGLLKQRAHRMENWLEEYWLNHAYLGNRNPLTVHSSPCQMFPRQKFCKHDDIVKCATDITMAALRFKQLIDKDMLKRDVSISKDPLDMSQYKKLFGGTRIPFDPLDRVVFKPESRHIVVMHKDAIHKLDVIERGDPIQKSILYGMIEAIVAAPFCPATPLGALTTERREQWSATYEIMRKDFQNRTSMKIIEDSLFALCIDNKHPEASDDALTTSAQLLFHGGGAALNGSNRWYDKTLQFVVEPNGSCGVVFEHASIDGMPVTALTDYIVDYLNKNPEPVKQSTPPKEIPERLTFNISDCIKDYIARAQAALDRTTSDVDLSAFSFDYFGKDTIKKYQLSPDSFIQMALQLSFYRLHREPCAQEELVTLRKFRQGRTESVRGCSEESVRFCQAMGSNCISCEAKAGALRLAVNTHRQLALAANNGQGVDRHLLGLMKVAEEAGCGSPDIFKSPAYTRSTYIRMNSSKMLASSNSFIMHAPVVADGYGCWYNARGSNINFVATTFASYPGTCASSLKDAVQDSLNDMKDVLERAPPQ